MTHNNADEIRRLRLWSWIAFGATTGLLAILEALLLAVPMLKKTMDERGLQLPTLTKTMIDFYAPACSLVLIFWLVLLLKEFSPLSRKITMSMNCLSLTVACVLTGTAIIGVFVPIVKLQQSMSKEQVGESTERPATWTGRSVSGR